MSRTSFSSLKAWLFSFIVLTLRFSFADAGKDFYKTLGVSTTANDKELKRAYRKLAMKWHPDKHPDRKDRATAKFQEIAEAYETLTDSEKRKLYDLGGEEAVKGQPPPQDARTAGEQNPGTGGSFRFYTHGGSGGGAGQHWDPKAFEEAFKMFRDGSSGFFPGGNMRGGGMPNAARQQPKQGGPLFVNTAVHELNFEDHELQIEALTKTRPAVVLLYASGGKSCPKSCHRIKREFIELAKTSSNKLHVAAVQCKRRRGRCAEYANSFPAVLLIKKGARKDQWLSKGIVTSSAVLKKKVDKAITQGVEELRPEHFKHGSDPCDGKFCLLLLVRGPESKTKSARIALVAAADKLEKDPVRAYYVQAEEHYDFAKRFEVVGSGLAGFMRSARSIPAAQVLLYRPKRMSFEFFEGDVTDGRSVADFVAQTINRGTPLSQKLKNQATM